MANLSMTFWMYVAGGLAALIAATVAFLAAKFVAFRRYLLWALLAALVVFLIVLCEALLPRWKPTAGSDIPLFGGRPYRWLLVFLLITLGVAVYLTRWTSQWLRARRDEASGAARGEFPDMDAAWDEILVRLSQAQIDLRTQRVFLLASPDEGWSAALVRSAGLQVFARAPETVAPIHAYAASDGLLLSCAGATEFGRQDGQGMARLEYLCKILLAQAPECPIVRGVAVLFPADWAAQPDAPKQAAALRDDLRAIQRVLKVSCPIYALFPQMEDTPGFRDFVARMPDAMRQSRCGFAIPGSRAFSGPLVQDGMVWLSGWFHTWILSQMAEDPADHEANNRLFSLGDDMRRSRKPWRNVLESAFSTHAQGDPILFRGCYCMGTGEAPEAQAFSAGLLRGARSRILADHTATTWSEEALAEDRSYRRLAWAVGGVGGGLCLLAWIGLLQFGGKWWLGLIAVLFAWTLAILRISLRS